MDQSLINPTSKIRSMANSIKAPGILALANQDDKPLGTDLKTRAMLAGISGIGTAGTVGLFDAALGKIIPGRTKLGLPILIGAGLVGGTGGYFFPDIFNAAQQVKKNKMSREEYDRLVGQVSRAQHNAFDKSQDVYTQGQAPIIKTAGGKSNFGLKVMGGISRGITGTARGIGNVMMDIPRGILHRTPRNIYGKKVKEPLGTKVWSLTTKGAAVGGIMYGTNKATQAVMAPRSRGDYNTHLRNNLLAGSIKPGELTQDERNTVQQMGMK